MGKNVSSVCPSLVMLIFNYLAMVLSGFFTVIIFGLVPYEQSVEITLT